MSYSPAPWDAVPWALRGFTVEFGMGSGVAPSLSPPGRRRPDFRYRMSDVRKEAGRPPLRSDIWHLSSGVCLRMGIGGFRSAVERLGPVSCTHCCASTSGLSTCWSCTALMARPGFEGSFPLRCFQRLSRPDLATRLCRWRDNRSTRGPSTPVLSY